jgi:hypothetical protein
LEYAGFEKISSLIIIDWYNTTAPSDKAILQTSRHLIKKPLNFPRLGFDTSSKRLLKVQ